MDLIAFDLQLRRITLISLKATAHNPSDREIGQLLEGVKGLSAELPGWAVIGILACRAPEFGLGRFATRTDLRVWGCEDFAVRSEAPAHLSHLFGQCPVRGSNS